MGKLAFEREKVKIIFKEQARISKNFPKRTAEELLNFGIINLNKPSGPKSGQIDQRIQRLLEQKKVGHAGTLDPMVTGVLPIGLGKAVRVLPVLTSAGKVYRGTMRMHSDIEKTKLQEAFRKFTGIIEQMPPRISAVKRELRKRQIYWFKILKVDKRDVEFEVGCEAGTYIRKLCHDIGKYLGTSAHMSALQRIQSGPLKIKNSTALSVVKSNYRRYVKTKQDLYIRKIILPPEKAVAHIQKVWIDDTVAEPFSHGSPVFVPGIIAYTSNLTKGKTTAVFDQQNNLIGLGSSALDSKELETAEKGMAIKTEAVFI